MPKTTEQNGVAERVNRTIIESATSMLHSSGLPTKLWAEACSCAVYVQNWMAVKGVDGKTPYEGWNGVKPNLSHLRIFGSDVFLLIPRDERGKFDPKAIKCQHVGYCETQKGFRAWDPVGRKVHTSRYVIFHEKILPICQGSTVFDLVPELFIESELDHSDLPSESLSIPPDIPVVDTDQMSPSEQQQEEATIHVRSASDVHLTESLPLKRKIKPVVRWSDESLTQRYACLAGTNEVPDEPNTPEEAINSAVWKAAIMEELSSLARNDTWELCSLPLGRKSIKCKWVLNLKQNADQFRCKARLVAKGFTQQAGIDYEETYSPVVRHDSLRVIFSVAAQKDLEMVQLDVTTAFLNGDLKEELYMEQPTGFVTPGKENQVCRLKKKFIWPQAIIQSMESEVQ